MFVEKLNKKQQGVYVIEEEKIILDGVWEGYLGHDNVNTQSISIYTGSKLTGDSVDNYFVSTPSETPWKTSLKVFSGKDKVYVTYETSGDQVEADDINLLQEVLEEEMARAESLDSKIDVETNRAIGAEDTLGTNLDNEVARAKGKELDLETKKANITYVDTELLKKYDKDKVYTKEEVIQLIDDLIGGSPDALDTLKEIADALNNDPDFAATITTEIAKKVDKIAGKGLSDENYTLTEKQKLTGIEAGANKYVLPVTLPASMITDLPTKLPADGGNADSATKLSTARKINGIEFDGSKDVTISDNTKEPSFSKNTAFNKNFGNVAGTVVEGDDERLSDSRPPTTHTHDDRYYTETESDAKFATKDDLGNAGSGDMLKSVYDTNNNGRVDRADVADSVAWSGVSDKPTNFILKGATWNELRGV